MREFRESSSMCGERKRATGSILPDWGYLIHPFQLKIRCAIHAEMELKKFQTSPTTCPPSQSFAYSCQIGVHEIR